MLMLITHKQLAQQLPRHFKVSREHRQPQQQLWLPEQLWLKCLQWSGQFASLFAGINKSFSSVFRVYAETTLWSLHFECTIVSLSVSGRPTGIMVDSITTINAHCMTGEAFLLLISIFLTISLWAEFNLHMKPYYKRRSFLLPTC